MSLITELRQVVADTYALIGQTHICHWNVRGPSFFSLHTAFEEQYSELFMAVDEIAERIRAKGALAPGGLANLATMAGIEEIAEDADAKTMVQHLVGATSKLLDDLRTARDSALVFAAGKQRFPRGNAFWARRVKLFGNSASDSMSNHVDNE